MFLTHKLKLLPSDEQKTALLITMERFNEACNFAALAAFRIKSANKLRLQREIYHEPRERYYGFQGASSRLDAWSFFQLRSFIEYKAKLVGVPLILVDPRNTSLTCPACGCVDKKNRKMRDEFQCVRCGFADPADHIAAKNVAARGRVSAPIVTSFLSDFVPTQSQAHE